mmetsp:Transcript_4115/g.10448  ORF Transcript_4115/g.10448 Transcript_4115/m.10448 type:complete len:340 (+) Transcript_4115:407-1426(+)
MTGRCSPRPRAGPRSRSGRRVGAPASPGISATASATRTTVRSTTGARGRTRERAGGGGSGSGSRAGMRRRARSSASATSFCLGFSIVVILPWGRLAIVSIVFAIIIVATVSSALIVPGRISSVAAKFVQVLFPAVVIVASPAIPPSIWRIIVIIITPSSPTVVAARTLVPVTPIPIPGATIVTIVVPIAIAPVIIIPIPPPSITIPLWYVSSGTVRPLPGGTRRRGDGHRTRRCRADGCRRCGRGAISIISSIGGRRAIRENCRPRRLRPPCRLPHEGVHLAVAPRGHGPLRRRLESTTHSAHLLLLLLPLAPHLLLLLLDQDLGYAAGRALRVEHHGP